MRRAGVRFACLCATAVLAGACGHSAPAKHAKVAHRSSTAAVGVCRPAAREAIARFLAVPAQSVAVGVSTGNNGSPQCTFTTRAANHDRVRAIANLYTGPQPYFILERTAVEAAQMFTARRLSPPPQALTGLGLEADWFPAEQQLMATDGIRLITVTVVWPQVSQARRRSLAHVIAPYYLKATKQGAANAHGYPSGG